MIFRWKGFSKRMKFAQDLLFCCNTILCQMAATAFLFPMLRTVLMSEWGTFWRVWKKQISSLWKYLSNAASFVLIGYVRAEFWILSEFLLCLNLNFWIVKQTNIREKMAVTSPFLDQFRIFLVQINTKGSLLPHVYLNRITQPLGGVMALTVPFLDRFLTFLF